ncbi:52 kDa repressor of the inhibitor of the protein kinase-like [Acyrthosiphon pisum]|uniref:HAT C-terminal dimerisation domain-containing protein n=1 Tax=Acyrthosiphon pisum TaxID=7029 RepID=A0A8R1X0Z7_ACYPI|nr:52 kDa repressor of the inhibitor of the protein kinase-like [Acyrthosiphon pisum]|eukprot:XP_008179475.1 PREDICTED: 52 kDa repressor of the inhibitor of the protein kinase-like [Acyrthosiphon pisum]
MRGEYEGLQALIREINPAAIYTWCYAHRLSLVVVQMSSCSANAVDTFGNLEQLYALISNSKKRVAIYENMQKERNPKARVHRLKRVETTRWMSYSSALNTVLLTYDIVINTLEQIKITENADFKARSKATGLIDFFLSERFVLTAICYKNLFNILDPVTKMFQSQDIDLLGAVNSLQAVSSSIKRLRSDDAFNDLCNEATKFMNKSEFTFTSLPIQRSRKNKLLSAITCIEERFHSKSQELLKDISLFSVSVLKKTKSDPNTLPNDAFNKFCSQCLHPSSATIDNKESSSDLEDSDEEEEKEDTVCHTSGLQSIFPTLYMALQIACTLPVSSTTPERTFSKLKIVKNRLRTTISQDRLEQ